MSDNFTTTPATATPGGQLTICYEFEKAGVTTPIVVKLDYSPGSLSDPTHELSPSHPCVTVTVNPNATSLILIDETGSSEDHAVPFS